jgi:hypothetical protein
MGPEINPPVAQADTTAQGELSVFAVDEQIPQTARVGYAALVMAYTRESDRVALSRRRFCGSAHHRGW